MRFPRRRFGMRHGQLLIGALALAALIAVNGPPMASFAKSEYHQWQITRPGYEHRYGHWTNLPIPADMRINTVHTIVLNTGKVLLMAGSGNNVGDFNAHKFESVVWDPKTGKFTKIPTPYDMFCSGHYILPDGMVLIAGGTSRYEQMASQIHYAAGVVTIANRGLENSARLPAGSVFTSSSGQRYRSTASVNVLPARVTYTHRDGRRIKVTVPSYTPLWVKAQSSGNAAIVRSNQQFAMPGSVPALTAWTMRATAFSITKAQQNYWGTRQSYLFNPYTEKYERVSDLNLARWYPTLVGLKDGDVLAVSGLDQFGRSIQGNSEIFSLKSHTWTIDRKLTKSFPTYPSLYLMPDGDLFFSGASSGYGPNTPAWRAPGIWNPFTNAFRPIPGLRDPNDTETAGSVLLPPAQAQRYAIIGGGGVGQSNASTSRIDIVDLKEKHPRWRPAGHLSIGTRYPEVVITPDDGVLISGGSQDYRGEHGSDLLRAYMYHPLTMDMSMMAPPLVGRDYHAEGVLLADGRILTVGGNPLFGNRQDTTPEIFKKTISIFSPPYLFHGPRPSLSGGPAVLSRGQTGVFTTPDPGAIVQARLIHPSSVTHVTDVQQRSIALPMRRTSGGVALTIPQGSGLVPAGWYMLFVDNRLGVPSVARWVQVR